MAKNPVTRSDFLESKQLLKKYDGHVAAVSEVMNRGEATIRAIKRSASWPKYQALVKKYQDDRKARDAQPSQTQPLLDTFNKPESRSKKHAAEVLDLNSQISFITADRDAFREKAKRLEGELKAQVGENIRLSRLNEKKSWHSRMLSKMTKSN